MKIHLHSNKIILKANSVIGEQPKLLKEYIPSDEWLKRKQEYIKTQGKDKFGTPRMLSLTGRYNQKMRLPVSLLKDIPGANGEQKRVRQNDLEAISKIMKETGKLPLEKDGEEYVPYITVGYDGTARVNEGNHRIMAADKLGWEYLPVEIKYFDGGELASGPLHPDSVLKMHKPATD
jgi:ParB-like chromosome segregation protein Spo0J